MATAANSPELEVRIKYLNDIPSLNKAQQDAKAVAVRGEAEKAVAVAKIEATGQATRNQKKLAAAAKLESDLTAMTAKETKRREILEERARQRMLAGHTTWSQKMSAGINSISMSIKGMAAMWVTSQVTQIIRDSFSFVGEIVETADAVGLTVNQYYSLVAAASAAGIAQDRLGAMITKLNVAAEKAGNGQSGMQMLDDLLAGVADGSKGVEDVAELLGTRMTLSFMRLAGEIKSADDAYSKFNENFEEDRLRRIADVEDEFELLTQKLKIFTGTVGIGLIENLDTIANSLTAGGYAALQYAFGVTEATAAVNDQVEAEKELKKELSTREQNVLLVDEMRAKLEQEFAKQLEKNKADIIAIELLEGMKLQYQGNSAALDALNRMLEVYIGKQKEVAAVAGVRASVAPGAMSRATPRANLITPGMRDFTDTTVEKSWKSLYEAKQRADEYDAALRRAEQTMNRMQQMNVIAGGVQGLTSAFMDLQAAQTQSEIQSLELVNDAEAQRWQNRSDMLRASGLETSALYRNELRQAQDAEKKREKSLTALKAKAFDEEKDARRVSVVMNTAEAIIRAWATLGPIFGPIGAGLAAATGAIQMATIAEQKNPYRSMREGGLIQARNDMDRTPFYGRDGEWVSTKEATIRNRRALEYMDNGGTVAGGGGDTFIFNNAIGTQQYFDEVIIPQIRQAKRRGLWQ